MAAPVFEYEWELGTGHAAEGEGEAESQEFFGALSRLARRGAVRVSGIGRAAARTVLRGLSGPVYADDGLLDCGALPRSQCRGGACGCGGSGTCEWAGGECRCMGSARESECEINPMRKIYPDAMMEHLGHAAAGTHSEAEAEALAGAMIPLAARIVPQAGPAIMRAAPGLACGLAGVIRALHRNPSTRPLVRTVPAIVRSTALSIGRQASQGVAVSPQAAVRTLARQTARILGNPARAAQAFRRSRILDRQLHRGGHALAPCSTCRNCGGRIR